MENRVWIITCENRGFTYKILLNTTEERLHDYMKTELPEAKSYSGASDAEVEAARTLRMPIYLY